MALGWPRGARAADDFELIVGRYRDFLLATPDLAGDPVGWTVADAHAWTATLNTEGRWPDLEYDSRAGGVWPTLGHLRRVRRLSREWADPKSPLHHDPATERVVLCALDHWTTKRYQNPNWWQNQIGVPQVMRDVIVLLGDRLAGTSREGAMVVLHQFVLQPPKFGANTVWSAELGLMAAALEHEATALSNASTLLADEIVVGGEQGIQDDFSFLQHGARLQQFHYGVSFLQDTVRIAWLLRGTPWALAADRLTLLADWAVEGDGWMSRGTVTVPGTLDRKVSRPGAMQEADVRRELRWLEELVPARAQALAKLRLRQEGQLPVLTGFRAFPHADFTSYHRTEFSFFLKTVSTRTELTETLLRENQNGRRLNWGDHYVLRGGTEYQALPPVWNWDLLPGVTAAASSGDTLLRQAFVGSIGDGQSGATVMDYRLAQAEKVTLSARKFWAMHGDVVVALIGDLRAELPGAPIRTALDQCQLSGAVTLADDRGLTRLTNGRHEKTGVHWIHHAGLLYVPLGAERLTITLGPVTGSWHDINLNYATDPVTLSVFLPVLEHGAAPMGENCGFVIMPCATPAGAAERIAHPTWSVLRNDRDVQAVRFADGTLMAAFYEAGELSVGTDETVQVDQPCLVLASGGQVCGADPTQQGRTVVLRRGDRSISLLCLSGGLPSAAVAW